MITISKDYLEEYDKIKRELTILVMRLADHLDIDPRDKGESDGFYKINWDKKKKALQLSIEELRNEVREWEYNNPECFI